MDYGFLSIGYDGAVREWIPVPGSAKARLLGAAIEAFEAAGFEAASVTAIARAAGTTTGALYHHFGSKQGLFDVVREELERRVRDRMLGAHAALGDGRAALLGALLVGFDHAVDLGAARVLSDPAASAERDVLGPTLASLTGDAPSASADVLLGALRAALATVADGADAATARRALAWALGG